MRYHYVENLVKIFFDRVANEYFLITSKSKIFQEYRHMCCTEISNILIYELLITRNIIPNISKKYRKIGIGVHSYDSFYTPDYMYRTRFQFQHTPNSYFMRQQPLKNESQVLKFMLNPALCFSNIDKCYRFYLFMSLCHIGSCYEIIRDPKLVDISEYMMYHSHAKKN